MVHLIHSLLRGSVIFIKTRPGPFTFLSDIILLSAGKELWLCLLAYWGVFSVFMVVLVDKNNIVLSLSFLFQQLPSKPRNLDTDSRDSQFLKLELLVLTSRLNFRARVNLLDFYITKPQKVNTLDAVDQRGKLKIGRHTSSAVTHRSTSVRGAVLYMSGYQ